jgi:hypothetical protein
MKRILMVLAGIAAISITGAALGQREPSDEEKERARVRIGITKEQQIQIEGIFADRRARFTPRLASFTASCFRYTKFTTMIVTSPRNYGGT